MLPFGEAFFMSANLASDQDPHIVILGAGFAGLRLARKLAKKPFRVTLIDRNNFHQFQPLFYQVATAGLAPSAIAFPIRKVFHKLPNVKFRIAEIERIDLENKEVHTDIASISYDHLVIALGADTNYFSNKQIEEHAFPMKSIQESLQLRNRILECMEKALIQSDPAVRRAYMNVVVVGGGPTGTEVSGAISEMRDYVLPMDYPELDLSDMHIHLVEAGPKLLGPMSTSASSMSLRFLESMGIEVHLNTLVESYDGEHVTFKGGQTIQTKTLIWAAGVRGNILPGIPEDLIKANGRIAVDRYNRVPSMTTSMYLATLRIWRSLLSSVVILKWPKLPFNKQIASRVI